MGASLKISDSNEKMRILSIVKSVRSRIFKEVVGKIHANVGMKDDWLYGTELPGIKRVLTDLDEIEGVLETSSREPVEIDDKHLPTLKMAICAERLQLAREIESRIQRVSSPVAIGELKERQKVFDSLMASDWYRCAEAAKFPRLTDVLTIECAEAAMGDSPFPERHYDEKFHILQAPGLFSPDLDWFRMRCGMRDLPVAVAFLDIDNFKEFNTDFGFPCVDLHFLPPFMRLLEATVFGRGCAYRYGGDEYVVSLPNADLEEGIRIMESFQRALRKVEYFGINRTPTVSIGIQGVLPECAMTNAEIYAQAEEAKDKAKRERKGAIAAWKKDSAEIYVVQDAQ